MTHTPVHHHMNTINSWHTSHALHIIREYHNSSHYILICQNTNLITTYHILIHQHTNLVTKKHTPQSTEGTESFSSEPEGSNINKIIEVLQFWSVMLQRWFWEQKIQKLEIASYYPLWCWKSFLSSDTPIPLIWHSKLLLNVENSV